MPTKDKAAEIAATAYPFPSRDSTGDEDTYNERLRNQLANNIRKYGRAERTRCVNYLKRIKQTSHEGEERFVHSFVDDLIEVIDPPKPKKGKVKRV
jgi:molecular chaperone GrpE (heat shock protein)